MGLFVLLIIGILIIWVVVSCFAKSSKPSKLAKATYETYKDDTLESAIKFSGQRVKEIAYSYNKLNNVPSSYDATIYDCLSDIIFFKDDSLL